MVTWIWPSWPLREPQSLKGQDPGVLPLTLQVLLAEFYKGAPDLVRFQEPWSPEHTYLDKLKVGCGTPARVL